MSSRNSNGNVPNVNWNGYNGKVNVNYYNPDNANGNLRARAEISVNKPPIRAYLFRYFIQPFIILDISIRIFSI